MEKTGIDINEKQEAVIKDWENRIITVSAGPGSGKSTTIKEKIRFLLNEGVNPRDILILSFTNKAVENLKKGLSEEVENAEQIGIYTFHSFSRRVLNEKPTFKNWIIKKAANELLKAGEEPDETTGNLNEFYYNKKLLFLDEAQDLNRMMYDLVRGMIHINKLKGHDLKVVALFDDDQAIFEYGNNEEEQADSGLIGRIRMIDEFGQEKCETQKYTRHYCLDKNYRACKELVEFTEDYREQNYEQTGLVCLRKDRMKSGKDKKGDLEFVKQGTEDEYVSLGFCDKNIISAVVITDKVCADVGKILDGSIELEERTIGILVYENEQVSRIYACLKHVCDKKWEDKVSVVRTHGNSSDGNWFSIIRLDEFDYILGQLMKKPYIKKNRIDDGNNAKYVDGKSFEKVKEDFRNHYKNSTHRYAVESFMKEYATDEENEWKITGKHKDYYNITTLEERLNGYKFDEFVNEYSVKKKPEKESGGDIVIIVSTIHKSKGLQFGCVYMSRIARDSKDVIRQRYVTMTRAMERLVIIDKICPEVKRKDGTEYLNKENNSYVNFEDEERLALIKEGLTEGELEINIGDVWESFCPVKETNVGCFCLNECFAGSGKNHFTRATTKFLQAGGRLSVIDEEGVFFVCENEGQKYWIERLAPEKTKNPDGSPAGRTKYDKWIDLREEVIEKVYAEIYAVVTWTVLYPPFTISKENGSYQFTNTGWTSSELKERIGTDPDIDYSWNNYIDEQETDDEKTKREEENRKRNDRIWIKRKVFLPKLICKNNTDSVIGIRRKEVDYYGNNGVCQYIKLKAEKNDFYLTDLKMSILVIAKKYDQKPLCIVLDHRDTTSDNWVEPYYLTDDEKQVINIGMAISNKTNLPFYIVRYVDGLNDEFYDRSMIIGSYHKGEKGPVYKKGIISEFVDFLKHDGIQASAETRSPDKRVNDKYSSDFQLWQRECLKVGIFADIDLLRYDRDSKTILQIYELKRSTWYDGWKPYYKDYMNYRILSNLSDMLEVQFYIIFNKQTEEMGEKDFCYPVYKKDGDKCYDDVEKLCVFHIQRTKTKMDIVPIKCGEKTINKFVDEGCLECKEVIVDDGYNKDDYWNMWEMYRFIQPEKNSSYNILHFYDNCEGIDHNLNTEKIPLYEAYAKGFYNLCEKCKKRRESGRRN